MVWRLPIFRVFDQVDRHEPYVWISVRKYPNRPFSPADFFIKAFPHISRRYFSWIYVLQSIESQWIIKTFFKYPDRLRKTSFIFFLSDAPTGDVHLLLWGSPCFFEFRCECFFRMMRNIHQNVVHEMHFAPLPRSSREFVRNFNLYHKIKLKTCNINKLNYLKSIIDLLERLM